MRVSDIGDRVSTLIRALGNRLTAEDNWGPEGKRFQVLTSRGDKDTDLPPTFMNLQDILDGISSAPPTNGNGSTPPIAIGEPGPPGPQGPPGVDGANGMVPTLIHAGETFTVPADKQALFKLPIEIEPGGNLEVFGALEQVGEPTKLDPLWPRSGHPASDEFDGGTTLDPKWNVLLFGTPVPTWQYNDPDLGPSRVRVHHTGTGMGLALQLSYHIPVGTPFSVSVGGSHFFHVNAETISLLVGDVGFNNAAFCQVAFYTSQWLFRCHKFVGGVFTADVADLVITPGNFVMRLERDASNGWRYWYSDDWGLNWNLIHSFVGTGYDIDLMQISTDSSLNPAQQICTFDYFRVNWLGAAL